MRPVELLHVAEGDQARTQELFDQQWLANARRTDRIFAVLMVVQWIAAVVASLILSPRTWSGGESHVHPHVWFSIFLGGALTSLPVLLAWKYSGAVLTRHVIAVAQISFSSLLIHVSGGRIETHFHVFGSLAFLAFYRDWRVLLPATALVAVDHFVRGVFWPETVFGVATASPWRWVEHAAWVIYEDVFLFMACRNGVRDMRASAARAAQLERTNREMRETSEALHLAKDAAEAASRAKSEFLANMSHEIRTPLNGILGFAKVLMQNGDLRRDERDEYLQTIHESGRRLLTLINDVLDLSKIESNQMEVERVRCSPHTIIAEAVSILRVPAQERGLNLEYFWKSEIPATIETDPSRLGQILMNLIGNAIKFTEVGSVQVTARIEGGDAPRLVIDVIDTGVGIPAESLERIFDPFVQADSSITRRFGGTGLGLSISRRLARLLGGDLKVSSEAGRGSIFTAIVATGPLVNVPMLQGKASDVMADSKTQHAEALPTLPTCRILLVEDGVTNRKLINLVLRRAGAEVQCAENGRLGVEAVERERFDLILMDMQMPVMDGYTATRELRRRGHLTPILALTAHAMKGDKQRCLDAGCSGYLTKPIDPHHLLQAVAETLGASASARSPDSSSRTEQQDESELADTAPLISTLALEDPDFQVIVTEFAVRLEEQLAELRTAEASADWRCIAELAHALKGGGGTAGFPAFTQPAADLERLAQNRAAPAAISAAIEQLERLAARIQLPASVP